MPQPGHLRPKPASFFSRCNPRRGRKKPGAYLYTYVWSRFQVAQPGGRDVASTLGSDHDIVASVAVIEQSRGAWPTGPASRRPQQEHRRPTYTLADSTARAYVDELVQREHPQAHGSIERGHRHGVSLGAVRSRSTGDLESDRGQ